MLNFGDFVKDEDEHVFRVVYVPNTKNGKFGVIDRFGRCLRLAFDLPHLHLPDYVDFDGPPAKTLQIEAGKYYRTQSGKVVGPAEARNATATYSWRVGEAWYQNNGRFWHDILSTQDLVAEVPAPAEPILVYEPWTFETMPIGVKCRRKDEPDCNRLALPINATSVDLSGATCSYDYLLDDYEQLDGSPCGVLVKP